ncbi:DUF6188 family protein [Nocardia vermiculata]|nr:DUF6188 family protein [Nocardia vermiculata]
MDLKLSDKVVSEIMVEFMVTIRMGERSEFELQIEGDIELSLSSGSVYQIASEEYDAQRQQLKSLQGSVIRSSTADESGALTLGLDSGAALRVPSDSDYEAWSVAGPGGYRVVSLPGGELAIWSAIES